MNRLQIDINRIVRLFKRTQVRGFVCLALLAGCADMAGTPVNVDVAQQTLTSVMESWKEGKSSEDLSAESPSIFVQETDWNDKTKLLEYEIVRDDEAAGPNLVATVKLKLSDEEGKIIQKTATYIVGTSPTLTVYRNLMR